MRIVSDKNCRENQNTHFVLNDPPPLKSCRLWDNGEKYCREGQATDGNITRRTHSEWWVAKATVTCSGYVIMFFFIATMVARKRFSVPLYVHRLSSFVLHVSAIHTEGKGPQKSVLCVCVCVCVCVCGLYLVVGAPNSRSWACPARWRYTRTWIENQTDARQAMTSHFVIWCNLTAC